MSEREQRSSRGRGSILEGTGGRYGGGRPYPLAFRLRVVEEVLAGTSMHKASRLIELARIERPEMPVAIFTGLDGHDWVNRASARGILCFTKLPPPSGVQQLLRQILLSDEDRRCDDLVQVRRHSL